MLRKSFAIAAGLALIAGSGAAAAQSAQSLSPSASPAMQRAAADSAGAEELGSRGWGIYVVIVLLVAGAVYGIIKLTDGDGDSISP